MRVIVTGGCGFIGSSFVNLLEKNGVDYLIVDKMTYAADINNIPDQTKLLVKDICDVTQEDLGEFDYIVNFAAESHVDNSIENGKPFVMANVLGVFNLLEISKKNPNLKKFIQISTDEVYGDMMDHPEGYSADIDSPINPSSYYSATKAAADLLVQSCHRTFNLPYLITRTCNNFGRHQHPEKFLPKIYKNINEGIEVPVYGDGRQVREWVWVEDNVNEIYKLMNSDVTGVYHISSGDLWENIEIIDYISELIGKDVNYKFVTDRLGHDKKYFLKSNKIQNIKYLTDYISEIFEDKIN
jgi:dTDP-glucose 4,6-dehydratase